MLRKSIRARKNFGMLMEMLRKSIRVATLIEKNVGMSMETLRKSIRAATLIEKNWNVNGNVAEID